MADHFWLNEAQCAVIEPHVPNIYTGKRRVDDRWVIICLAARSQLLDKMSPDPRSPIKTMAASANTEVAIIP
jgi:hypothetical protein